MKILNDIIRVNKCFVKQFYGMYTKFYFLNVESLAFLLQSFCFSFYGSELWYDTRGNKAELNRCGVAYHRCIKKITNMTLIA